MKRSNNLVALFLTVAATATASMAANAELVTFEGVGLGDQFSFVNGPYRSAEATFDVPGQQFMYVYSESGPNAAFLPLGHAVASPNGTLRITPRTTGNDVTLSGIYGQIVPTTHPAAGFYQREVTFTGYNVNGVEIGHQVATFNSIFGNLNNYVTFAAPVTGARIEISNLGIAVPDLFPLLNGTNPNTRTIKDSANAPVILDNINVSESVRVVPVPESLGLFGVALLGMIAVNRRHLTNG